MQIRFFILIISFILPLTMSSQSDENYDLEDEYEIGRVHFFDASFSIYLPSGAFSEKVDDSSFLGFSLSYLYQLKLEKPAFLGVEFYHMNLGTLTRNYEQAVSGEIIDITGKMSSNFLGMNILFRYYPSLKIGPVEPFFEGQFGGRLVYSYLSESGFFSNDETYGNFDYLDGNLVLSYGGAIGVQVNLTNNFYLSLKAGYNSAVSTEYYKRIKDEVGVFPLLPADGFEMTKSAMDIVKFDLGLTYLY